jgi:beta-phosphoglucomutase-like phosphatase (HAD superfamily)
MRRTTAPKPSRRSPAALGAAELRAADTAQPTPGAAEFLAACRDTGQPVAIVSNNSVAAVRRYLKRARLTPLPVHVVGRLPGDPALMKPHPELVRRAIDAMHADPAGSALVGDRSPMWTLPGSRTSAPSGTPSSQANATDSPAPAPRRWSTA